MGNAEYMGTFRSGKTKEEAGAFVDRAHREAPGRVCGEDLSRKE